MERPIPMYLYAISDCPEAPLPVTPGLEDAPLLNVRHRGIAAVASALTRAVSPVETNLWQHEAVLEALMTDRAILPVRFGTLLTGEDALRDVLTAHYADFVADLDHVRGRVELGLRVLWQDEQEGGGATVQRRKGVETRGSGRAYMMARLEEERGRRARRKQAEALASEINTPLVKEAVDSTHQVLVTPRFLLTAAYLVERGAVEVFQQQVQALNSAYSTLRLLCTGPWPAYSFVTASTFPTGEGGNRG
jgi:hypothetical protein